MPTAVRPAQPLGSILAVTPPRGAGVGLVMVLGLLESCWNQMDKPAPKALVAAMVKGPATAGAAPAAGLGAGVTRGFERSTNGGTESVFEDDAFTAGAGDARVRRKGMKVWVRCKMLMLKGNGINMLWSDWSV